MNKTKKNRYFNSLNPLLETNYLKMLSYKKQKGSGTIYSRFRNSRVQPEENYTYENYNNTQVVPLDFVTPHQYSKFRCIWKRGTPTDEFMENDPLGNRVDDWIIVIFNPIDRNESDWLFVGTTDETVLDDVEYEIRHYRSLLLPSFFKNVYDYISDKSLSTYDIRLKIYQLLAIKYYIRYNPIQEARAEIIRPAEPTYIANGGKKNKNKTQNIYEAISIISKRAEQINGDVKKELIEKLEEFATYNDSLEEIFENKEQIEVSKFYERLPKPHAIAVQEWLEDKVYHRDSSEDIEE